MKPTYLHKLYLLLAAIVVSGGISSMAQRSTPRFRHVENSGSSSQTTESCRQTRTAGISSAVSEEEAYDSALLTDSLVPRSIEEILESLPPSYPYRQYTFRAAGPWVISGYRPLTKHNFSVPDATLKSILGKKYTTDGNRVLGWSVMPTYNEQPATGIKPWDLAEGRLGNTESIYSGPQFDLEAEAEWEQLVEAAPMVGDTYIPEWLREALINQRIQDDAMYAIMVAKPNYIEYAYWDLPEPPRLPEEDPTFAGFIKRLNLPQVDPGKAVIVQGDLGRYNWLHTVSGSLQISQAYISRNWYQGGNNYLSVLFNFLWDVNLNQVFHPKSMLQSTLTYKLGVNTTPKGSAHKYQITADNFQWNFKTGLKAFTNKWFYSFNLQFKTQLLCNYASDSETRTASFLSPAELNLGLGMTYNHANKANTFKFSLSISPLSYNLKASIDDRVDRSQFNIVPPHKSVSEIGSNLEANMDWKIRSNISWRSRFFVFSDYKTVLGDWENTLDFAINRFLSTQLYFHLRYDTSTPSTFQTGWKKWQFKELLSFGLSYTFSTKP